MFGLVPLPPARMASSSSELIAIWRRGPNPGSSVIFSTAEVAPNGAEIAQTALTTSTTSALVPSEVTAAPARPPAAGIERVTGVEPDVNGAVKILTILPMGAKSVLPSGDSARSPQPTKSGIVNATAV